MNYSVKLYAYIPPPLYGGVTVYVKRLALSLCKLGYPSGAFYIDKLVGVPREYSKFFDKMVKHARSFYILPELIYLYKICKDYQLIHSHLSLNAILGMWVVHKLQKKPLIITIHNEMIEKELEGMNFLDLACIRSLFKDEMVQIICVSKRAKELLEEKFTFFKNEIKIIPAYIKPVEIGMPADYLSESLIHFMEEHKRYIVFYAESFAENKGIDIYGTKDCINAFISIRKLFPDVSLVFCMPNVNNYEKIEELKRIILNNNLSEYVYWQTSPLTEMWPLLKKAAVYLRTTSTDGDSVLLREALGLGVPSLASDIVKRPNSCILYKYGDSHDLEKHLIDILQHPTFPIPSNQDYFQEMLEIYKSFIKI